MSTFFVPVGTQFNNNNSNTSTTTSSSQKKSSSSATTSPPLLPTSANTQSQNNTTTNQKSSQQLQQQKGLPDKNLRELFSLRSELTRKVEALKNAVVIETNLVNRGHRAKNLSSGNHNVLSGSRHPNTTTTNTAEEDQQTQQRNENNNNNNNVSSSTNQQHDNKNSNINHSTATLKEKVFAAVLTEDAEYLHSLLSDGADPNYRDYRNRTPLHVACFTGNLACVELLVEFGADITAVDDKNQTAREVALFHNHQIVVATLDPRHVETLLEVPPTSFAFPNNSGGMMLPSSNTNSFENQQQHQESSDGTGQNVGVNTPSSSTSSTLQQQHPSNNLAITSTTASLPTSPMKIQNVSQQQQQNTTAALPNFPLPPPAKNPTTAIQQQQQQTDVLLQSPASCTSATDGAGGGSTSSLQQYYHQSSFFLRPQPAPLAATTNQQQQQGLSITTIHNVNNTNQSQQQQQPSLLSNTNSNTVNNAASSSSSNNNLLLDLQTKQQQNEQQQQIQQSTQPIYTVWEKRNQPSAFRAVGDTESVVVCMVGLPGRGKSFLSKNCARFLRWKGVPTRVFNAGDYRRRILGVEGTRGASFYDKDNTKAKEQRELMAHMACEDAANFIKSQPVAVAFIDATNTNRARRQWLLDFFCPHIVSQSRILFIESVCDDDEVITQNILRDKVTNGDYDTIPVQQVVQDFHARIEKYREQYEPIDPLHDEELCFLKVINLKQTLVANRITGRLQTLISTFITNLHPVAHSLYLVVPGPYSRTKEDDISSSSQQVLQNRNDSSHTITPSTSSNNIVTIDELLIQQNNNTTKKAPTCTSNTTTNNTDTHHVNLSTGSVILPHIPPTILSSSNVASNLELDILGQQIAGFVREKVDRTKTALENEKKRCLQEAQELQQQQQREQNNPSTSNNNGLASSATPTSTTLTTPGSFKSFTNSSFLFEEEENKFLIAHAEDASCEKTAMALKRQLMKYQLEEGWNVLGGGCNNTNNQNEEEHDFDDEEEEEEDDEEEEPTLVTTTNNNTNNNNSSVYVDIQIDTVHWLQAMSYGLCEGMSIEEATKEFPRVISYAFQPLTAEPIGKDQKEIVGPDAMEFLQKHSTAASATVPVSNSSLADLKLNPPAIATTTTNTGNAENNNNAQLQNFSFAGPSAPPPSTSTTPSSSLPLQQQQQEQQQMTTPSAQPTTINTNTNTNNNNNNPVIVVPTTQQEMMSTYVTGYPKGESLRQVAVRVSSMVMQWKRTDSPLLCICSVAPATLLVAFAADLPPEAAAQLRLPRNTIIEVTAKHAVVLRTLLKYEAESSGGAGLRF